MLRRLPQRLDLTAGWLCCLPEPDAEGRTEPEAQSPPARPSPVKSLFRRMSDRIVRLDLSPPAYVAATNLPSSLPSSPTSSSPSQCSSWRLHIAGLCKRLGFSDLNLATSLQTQPPSCNPVSPCDLPLSPTLPCPKLKSSLSPRHIPSPSYLEHQSKSKHQP